MSSYAFYAYAETSVDRLRLGLGRATVSEEPASMAYDYCKL
jgi:hypothetical protein